MARLARALAAAALVATAAAASQLRVSNVFGNHSVLQRGGAGATIWGWDAPGATVSVSGVGPAPVTATAGADGLWRARLPPQPAGGPFIIKISSSAGGAVALEDVLFGDVWLCGGQSNMEFTVAQAFNATAEIAAADDPGYRTIRVFTVGEGTGNASAPLPELATISQPWSVASSTSIGVGNWSAFSAVCWFTARDVFNSLNRTVPMGLVSNNWGGTAIELWVPPPAIAACPGGSGGPSNSTSKLYNGMIAPYTVGPMAAAAVLWFQGEANASGEQSGGVYEWARYGCLFAGLVEAWRAGLGPGPDGQPLWFSLGHLEPWNAPPEYNGVFAGLRAQQIGQGSAGLPPRVTFASAADLGDPTSPFHPVHYRNKQTFGARQAAALLATAYAGEPAVAAALTPAAAVAAAGGPFYPTAVSASGTGSAADGAKVVVVFDPATVGPAGLALSPGSAPLTPCPVGGPYNFSAGSCAWPTVVDAAGVAHNASWIGINGGGGGTLPAATLAVPPSAGVADGTPLSVSYGWGVWPVLTLYAAPADGGTPALPFNLTVAAPTVAAAVEGGRLRGGGGGGA